MILKMKKDHIPYRQIHLDFHTSPEIPAVGARFDADEFTATLKRAHVESINLFAKCHHGMYYYPTAIGTQHPALNGFDLFGAQVEACREAGIRPVAYTCVSWNEDWAKRHPEWLMVTYDGTLGNKLPFETGYYKWNTICFNNPEYRKVLKTELEEIWRRYHPAGFWIDIVTGHECVCPVCKAEMLASGMDPTDRNQVIRHDRIAETAFCRDIYEFLKDMNSELDVYFNSHPYALDDATDAEASSVTKRQYFTFLDIESLPSDKWGYSHFPIAAAYVQKYPQEIAMMNGKFHMSWGDFGSLRNEKALEYECFRALAWGAKVCVGDQLHPCGRLDPVVYERIGKVFASIEAKETWLHGTRPVAEIGAFIASSRSLNSDRPACIEEGVYRVLQELHQPFHFLNMRDSLEGYRLLILPDHFVPDAELAARLDRFVEGGGKLLLTGDAGVDPERGEYVLRCVRAKYRGESPFSVRYIRATGDAFRGLPKIDHVLYERGCVLERGEGETVAARIVDPYFERGYERFCSHRQTPPTLEETEQPAILFGDGYAILSSPLFTDYLMNGYQAHRELIRCCIEHLLPRPLIVTDLPAISEVTLRRNEDAHIVHILNYVLIKKSKRIETIEDEHTALDRTLRVRLDHAPSSVCAVPGGEPLAFRYEDGYAVIELPKVSGHTMIEIG